MNDEPCQLCTAERVTRWHYEDAEVWIADCVVCLTPMIVWRTHGLPDEAGERRFLDLLEDVARDRYPQGYRIDGERRRIPDHWHAHARPLDSFFDPASELYGRVWPPDDPSDAPVVRAAGGVVWRQIDGTLQIVLVSRRKYADWSLPKGKLEPGETDADAAIREVEEETGLRCTPGMDLGTVSYRDGRDRPKVVRYYEMAAADGEPAAANEVAEVRWVAAEEARQLLTFELDAEVVDRFLLRR